MSNASSLYEKDFVRWSFDQASALREAGRSGTTLPLDWENLAEEVESLGRSQRRELASRIATIIEHLLKLEFSPAKDPRGGWGDTVDRERMEIQRLLEQSPSLEAELPATIETELRRAIRFAARTLERHGEDASALVDQSRGSPRYTLDQVLGDWFPEPKA